MLVAPEMVSRGLPIPRLKALRLGKFLTQEELAEKSGVSRFTIARVENEGKPAELRTIRALAIALETTPDALTRP